MTAVLDADRTAATTESREVHYAGWAARAGALAVDVLPATAVVATMALLAFTTPLWGWLWWILVVTAALALVAAAVNRWILPSVTGWSLGRSLFGIRIVTASGMPAGGVRLLLRDLAHVLDTLALVIGWLWPLWDSRNRTFADLLARTEARRVARPQRDVRRPAGVVLLVAALLCVAGSGLAYLVVYRQDRAVEAARTQIAAEGPRMVEQMLSYGAASMQPDFARSLDLATEAYRPQLAAQQQLVEKGGATTNEYWSTNSAVLSDPPVTPEKATMLLALQGQRGTDPKSLKFISATVRVEFEKSGDRWLVNSLIVLKKPTASEAGG